MSTPVVEFENVRKTYRRGDSPAVDGVSLSVSKGEILALAGASGSGKSTLLRLACGLEHPDDGHIRIRGEVVAGRSMTVPPELRRVGVVFQDGALFPHMTVAANATYGIRKLNREEKQKRVERLLELTGLQEYAGGWPHEMSGGERQRLALVRSLAPEPDVLLLDEPFSHLDPPLRRSLRFEVTRILKELRVTCVVVTHDVEDAMLMADRVAVLESGRLIQEGIPPEVYGNPVNRYAAELFGPVNRVTNRDGVEEWVRPERMAVSDESSAVLCRVRRITNMGKGFEVIVSPKCDPETLWTMNAGSLSGIEGCGEIGVTW